MKQGPPNKEEDLMDYIWPLATGASNPRLCLLILRRIITARALELISLCKLNDVKPQPNEDAKFSSCTNLHLYTDDYMHNKLKLIEVVHYLHA